MGLSDKHRTCIRERAVPVLINRQGKVLGKQLLTMSKNIEALAKTERDARNAHEDNPHSKGKRNAYKLAHEASIKAQNEAAAKQEEIRQMGTWEGQLEVIFDNWDRITDGATLEDWCEEQELIDAEEGQSEQEEKIAQTRIDLDKKKAERAARLAGPPAP